MAIYLVSCAKRIQFFISHANLKCQIPRFTANSKMLSFKKDLEKYEQASPLRYLSAKVRCCLMLAKHRLLFNHHFLGILLAVDVEQKNMRSFALCCKNNLASFTNFVGNSRTIATI